MDRRRQLRELFDRSDRAIHQGKGYSEYTNEKGLLAWTESYILLGYIEMYRATRDRFYLRQLVDHFDRLLRNRDDVRGIADVYAGKPLAGWGSQKYSNGKWHVWIVHTGMITLAPAEFVRLVRSDRWLQKELGAKAQEYRKRIEECIRDADPYWRNGPADDEGYYYDPHIGDVLPLNQQNAMGCVLIEMWRTTGNNHYLDKALRLARFFRNRLRTDDPHLYDWSYYPKLHQDGKGSEDISHASLNVEFAARCVADGIVFGRKDAIRFANTWLLKVRQADGTWAGEVGGRGDGSKYMPDSGGMWLNLCKVVPREIGRALYHDVERAYLGKEQVTAGQMVGLARLVRYASLTKR